MIEVALCLAIIGFALVSILAVLPLGMDSQQKTREATVISQDATMFLEALRGGARGMNDLTNYVVAITNFYQNYDASGRPVGILHRAGYSLTAGMIDGALQSAWNLTNGLRIVGVLSTPEFTSGLGGPPTSDTYNVAYTSNRVYAYVRSVSGLAVEKPPQNNDILRGASFSYRILCVNAPVAMATNTMAINERSTNAFDQELAGNLRQLWLSFRWPLLPNSSLPVRFTQQDYRADIAGQVILTNDVPSNPRQGMWLYFCQPELFINTP